MDSGTFLALGMGLAVVIAVTLGASLPHMLARRDGLNETEDWTPGHGYHEDAPSGRCLTPFTLRLVTSYLEHDETLEGFARGMFFPARRKDWKFGSGIEKLPLIVAATSRRVLLFDVTLLTVHSTCFVRYDAIASIDAPKTGRLGTSGRMRLVLKSGREYQFGFHGPLLDSKGMEYEQDLAEHFRQAAARLESSPDGAPLRAAA